MCWRCAYRRKSGGKNVITVGEFLLRYIGALKECACSCRLHFLPKRMRLQPYYGMALHQCILSALSLHFNYFCFSKGAIKLGINIHYSRLLHSICLPAWLFSFIVEKALMDESWRLWVILLTSWDARAIVTMGASPISSRCRALHQPFIRKDQRERWWNGLEYFSRAACLALLHARSFILIKLYWREVRSFTKLSQKFLQFTHLWSKVRPLKEN